MPETRSTMRIETIKITDLIPASYNPRVDLQQGDPEYEKIKRSIEEFGYVDPIIVNKDNTVIGGHQRVKVLKDLGYEEITCVIVDMDKDHEKALNIALNKISGDWDNDKLKDLLQELDTGAIDMDLTGFDFDEIEKLIGQTHQEEAEEDDFDADGTLAGISEATTKLGDVWQLGRHRLMCGDCTDEATIGKLMDDKLIKLILTDPPYNVNYGDKAEMLEDYDKGHHNIDRILNDNMSDESFYNFLYASFSQLFNAAEQGCPIYVFHSDSEGFNFRKAYKDAGFKLAECLVWVKNTLVLGRQDYQWRHEPILYGWKEGAAHHWYGERNKTTVFEEELEIDKMSKADMATLLKAIFESNTTILYENKPAVNDPHPTMKPLKLCGKLISNSSEIGDIVADFFGGSGSTLMAAEQLDRKCYMMELDPKYVDVIIKRWENFTGGKAEKI
jgi:DNA modification methylase